MTDQMDSTASEHHAKAAEHHEAAGRSHREAAKAATPEKQAHYAQLAQGQSAMADHHAKMAACRYGDASKS